uniref:Cadherin domain-containing protein n=1 Tax=Anopheles coluzzii TaxID=1518534 RepID=A0A8W7Q1Y9_ANOCL
LASLDLETKPNYWLTVCAQDQAVVPLHSCVQVYIEVQNENDNVPLTEDAVYYPSVPESSPPNVKVLQLAAEDRDIDPLQQISYRIISGNPEGNFAINSTSGLITTTARKLDRENQPEHILEVLVMDNGEPQLSSTTRVVVQVEDVNDHAPEFDQKMYKVQIPANAKIDQPLFQVSSPLPPLPPVGMFRYVRCGDRYFAIRTVPAPIMRGPEDGAGRFNFE